MTETFWGVSATAWTALTAIGTLALAAATVWAILASLRSAKKAREHDDMVRNAAIARDDELRNAQFARDDLLRKEDRDHEAEVRRQDAAEWERRRLEEQQAREDYEARQVIVKVEADLPQTNPDSRLHRLITISNPAIYPIRQVNVRIAGVAGSGYSILSLGHSGDTPALEAGRVVWRFRGNLPQQGDDWAPIVSFVDVRGNLYYQFRNHTRRFPADTSFETVMPEIQRWINTGPGSGTVS